ncbi:hypothetical protein [Streptantibioticus ferralitis]|uniref:DUF8017 domain-containing protein n=1 Tax=Streptantibioticus ferralitis TaxID=236510 RepID=A0ABT5YXQ9_9ACTN|nr:hypothetical protein [Streptantibioticus ferralitis]MDF2256388.1 hypothetical protein [Streptantibioticus ferralitis]
MAIGAALAVIATGVGVTLALHSGGKKTTESKRPVASPSPSQTTNQPQGDTPNSSGGDVQPVVAGWQVVEHGSLNVAFDVPKDWTVEPAQATVSFNGADGFPAVMAGGVAEYKPNYCSKGNTVGVAGTRPVDDAKNLQDAAVTSAEDWVYYGFTDPTSKQHGTLKYTPAAPFSNQHGITGYAAEATASDVPKANQCTTDGAAYTVAWLGDDGKPVVAVILTNTTGPEQVSPQTITTVEGSLRRIHSAS